MKRVLILDGYNLIYRARYSGMSKGEYSTVFLGNVEISQNNIGIAIKDSSFAEIKSINTDTKPELSFLLPHLNYTH